MIIKAYLKLMKANWVGLVMSLSFLVMFSMIALINNVGQKGQFEPTQMTLCLDDRDQSKESAQLVQFLKESWSPLIPKLARLKIRSTIVKLTPM